MSAWPTRRLGGLTNVLSGFAFDSGEFSDSEGQPLVRIRDVLPGRTATYYKGSFDPRYLVDSGDILIGMDGEFNRARWRGGKALLNQRVSRIVSSSGDLDDSYLFHFLPAALKEIEKVTPFVTVKHLSVKQIRDIEIPLPPLAEQRRIAEILNKAEALRAKRHAALAQLDTLTQSIFLDMFGDLLANERRWPTAPVGHFVSGFETGKNLVADDEDDVSTAFRVLKVSAVTSLRFRGEESKALPPTYVPPPSHFVRQGDLLFSRANTAELIGATALVENVPQGLVLPDKLWRFRWYDEPRADPRFVQWLFRQRKFRFELGRRATGTSGSMKNISQEKVLSIKVPLPPLKLQHQFGRVATAVEHTKWESEKALGSTEHLFESLQHRAFGVEL